MTAPTPTTTTTVTSVPPPTTRWWSQPRDDVANPWFILPSVHVQQRSTMVSATVGMERSPTKHRGLSLGGLERSPTKAENYLIQTCALGSKRQHWSLNWEFLEGSRFKWARIQGPFPQALKKILPCPLAKPCCLHSDLAEMHRSMFWSTALGIRAARSQALSGTAKPASPQNKSPAKEELVVNGIWPNRVEKTSSIFTGFEAISFYTTIPEMRPKLGSVQGLSGPSSIRRWDCTEGSQQNPTIFVGPPRGFIYIYIIYGIYTLYMYIPYIYIYIYVFSQMSRPEEHGEGKSRPSWRNMGPNIQRSLPGQPRWLFIVAVGHYLTYTCGVQVIPSPFNNANEEQRSYKARVWAVVKTPYRQPICPLSKILYEPYTIPLDGVLTMWQPP